MCDEIEQIKQIEQIEQCDFDERIVDYQCGILVNDKSIDNIIPGKTHTKKICKRPCGKFSKNRNGLCEKHKHFEINEEIEDEGKKIWVSNTKDFLDDTSMAIGRTNKSICVRKTMEYNVMNLRYFVHREKFVKTVIAKLVDLCESSNQPQWMPSDSLYFYNLFVMRVEKRFDMELVDEKEKEYIKCKYVENDDLKSIAI
jgi:hypothetical protein